MGNLSNDAKWQMLEIKGNEDSPMTLEVYISNGYANHWNITDALKSGPAHSVIIASMPNRDIGS